MIFRFVIMVIAFLGVTFWLARINGRADQVTNPSKDAEERKDELDDAQAAETVATWNLLNPP